MAPRKKAPTAAAFEMPDDFSRALAGDRVARTLFARLPEPNQRAFVAWILESRYADIRVLRVLATIERVSNGHALPFQ